MAAKRFTIFFFVVLFLSIPIYLNDIIVRSTSSSELCFSFFLLAFFQKHAPTQTQGGTHTDWVCFTLEHNTFMFERVFVAVRHWRWREKKIGSYIYLIKLSKRWTKKKKNCSHSASAETFKSFLNFSWDARFESNCLTLTIRNVNNWVISFWFFLSQLRRRRKNHLLTLARR